MNIVTFGKIIFAFLIVFVIAAILFPALPERRDRIGPHCQNNLKQLNLGFLVYEQDNDDRMPLANWTSAIYPYVKSTEVYCCPAVSTDARNNPPYPISYAMNENLIGALGANVAEPSRTVTLFEISNCIGNPTVPSARDGSPYGLGLPGVRLAGRAAAGKQLEYATGDMGDRKLGGESRHGVEIGEPWFKSTRREFSFCVAMDGHARSFSPSSISQGRSQPGKDWSVCKQDTIPAKSGCTPAPGYAAGSQSLAEKEVTFSLK